MILKYFSRFFARAQGLQLQDFHFKFRINIRLTNEKLTTLHIAGEYGASVVVKGISVVSLSSLVPFAVNKIKHSLSNSRIDEDYFSSMNLPYLQQRLLYRKR